MMSEQGPVSASELIDKLTRLLEKLRARPEDVEQAVEQLLGRTSESPDLLYIYPQERRQHLVDEIARSAGLSADELSMLMRIASATLRGGGEGGV